MCYYNISLLDKYVKSRIPGAEISERRKEEIYPYEKHFRKTEKRKFPFRANVLMLLS